MSVAVNLFNFVALVYMFCYVEVLPFQSKKDRYIAIGGTGITLMINILIFLLFPEIRPGQIALFTQTLPSMLICWSVARHKDMRFLFVFCSLDVIAFMFLLIANGLTSILKLGTAACAILNVLFCVPLLCGFRRYGIAFREMTEKVQKKWGRLASFVLIFYLFSYFLILYPKPWMERPEYAPVLIGYAVLILYCFYIIVWMLIDMNRLHEMEQAEYEMRLQIEKQHRELEEKKSRIMMNKIQPHFIYNVLMSIRYFTKKDSQVAYDMIYDFSNYLRTNVEQLENVGYISWAEELEHINAYVRIEKMRFKDRLNVIYEIEEEDFLIPPLTVEPLVENAVKHGVAQRVSGGTVWIRSRKTDSGYEIMIEDDGVGFDAENLDYEKSVGLGYIRARLAMMEGAAMRIESAPGQNTRIWLTFEENRKEKAG